MRSHRRNIADQSYATAVPNRTAALTMPWGVPSGMVSPPSSPRLMFDSTSPAQHLLSGIGYCRCSTGDDDRYPDEEPFMADQPDALSRRPTRRTGTHRSTCSARRARTSPALRRDHPRRAGRGSHSGGQRVGGVEALRLRRQNRGGAGVQDLKVEDRPVALGEVRLGTGTQRVDRSPPVSQRTPARAGGQEPGGRERPSPDLSRVSISLVGAFFP